MTDLSRRSVLHRLAQGTAFISAGLPSLSALTSSLGAAPDHEAFWEMVRRQFPFREARVPMNAANLCPAPRVVAEAVVELTQDIDVDCSFNNRRKFTTMLELSRKQVADQLGVGRCGPPASTQASNESKPPPSPPGSINWWSPSRRPWDPEPKSWP